MRLIYESTMKNLLRIKCQWIQIENLNIRSKDIFMSYTGSSSDEVLIYKEVLVNSIDGTCRVLTSQNLLNLDISS